MHPVSPIKQLGIVLTTQMTLMVLVGIAVVGTNHALGAPESTDSLVTASNCSDQFEQQIAAEKSDQKPKLPSARGGSFKFLAF